MQQDEAQEDHTRCDDNCLRHIVTRECRGTAVPREQQTLLPPGHPTAPVNFEQWGRRPGGPTQGGGIEELGGFGSAPLLAFMPEAAAS